MDLTAFAAGLMAQYPVVTTVILIAGMIIPLASFVANLTPNKTDDAVVATFAKVVNWLALNFNINTDVGKKP